MARSVSRKSTNLFLRKTRKGLQTGPKLNYIEKLERQREALKLLKQVITNPASPSPQNKEEIHEISHVLSSLADSYKAFNCNPTPQAYHFIIQTLAKRSQVHHIPSVLDRLERIEKFETPETICIDLIKIYGKANQLENAVDVFDRIPKFRANRTVFSLNVLLSVLSRTMEGMKMIPTILRKSCDMNIRMEESTIRTLMGSLCKIKRVRHAIEIFLSLINDGFDFDLRVCSLLLSSLCKQPDVSCAEVTRFIAELRKLEFCFGLDDYKGVIRFLVKAGSGMDAMDVLWEMKSNGTKPDIVCYNLVLIGVITNGDFEAADTLFDELLVLGLVPNINTFNAYIVGLCKQGHAEAAMGMIASMHELGCKPNFTTYDTLRKCFCEMAKLLKRGNL